MVKEERNEKIIRFAWINDISEKKIFEISSRQPIGEPKKKSGVKEISLLALFFIRKVRKKYL